MQGNMKKFKDIRNAKLKEEAPVNSAGPAVATDVPVVRKPPLILKRKKLSIPIR